MTRTMSQDEACAAFTAARVSRLATVDAEGRPHLVPITFVVDAGRVYFAVDAKPKRSPRLRRLANIEENPHVSLLADEYSEDWEQLWWARADGTARVLAHDDGAVRVQRQAADMLRAKYPQYAGLTSGEAGPDAGTASPFGPVVEIRVSRWSGWRWR